MGRRKRNKKKKQKKKQKQKNKTYNRQREIIVVKSNKNKKRRHQYRIPSEDIDKIAKQFFPQGYYCVGNDSTEEDADQVFDEGMRS